ncbi:hypothetical protein FGRMN_8221 [Fusarium graminum]|nr:hypothetical protein FGRMN_8221 [Fusarium graminum]
MVIEKGNKISIPGKELTATEITVTWSQNLSMRSIQYYVVPIFNQDQENEESLVFIQREFLDLLKAESTPGDDLTVVVNDSFQYGWNKEKNKRWLVFHDMSNILYQRRFVQGLYSKLGKAILTFAGGFSYITDLKTLEWLLDDHLHNF